VTPDKANKQLKNIKKQLDKLKALKKD
jgi:hypothetical protein